MAKIWPLFVYFRPLIVKNSTINAKALIVGRMAGADESTELWRALTMKELIS